LLAFAAPGLRGQADAAERTTDPVTLKPVSDFDSITDKSKRAVALFEEAGKVIQSPRCLNCHPATERPTQTDAMRPHHPLVIRGEAGMGAPGDRFALLTGRERPLPAELHAVSHGARPAFARAGADQLALELGQAAEHGQHQAGRGRHRR
jgi:hypothetical protein